MGHLANFDSIILFFLLGAFASWIRSDLEFPEPISKTISCFLLLSLGLKGGHEVRIAQDLNGFFPSLSIGLVSCLTVPMALFFAFKKHLGLANASAISASFGSVSAVTFVTAQGVLENENIVFSGYMVAIMALMEIPAIVLAVGLYQRYLNESKSSITSLFQSVLSAKSVLLLLGGFAIGFSMNQSSWSGISLVFQGCFKGVLALFLLDLGFVAQKNLGEAWRYKGISVLIALVAPLIFGTLTLFVGRWVGLSQGNLILITILVGSASYIAAPAAIRSSIPKANPSLYLAMPLALTFPMNLFFGIPFYMELSRRLYS